MGGVFAFAANDPIGDRLPPVPSDLSSGMLTGQRRGREEPGIIAIAGGQAQPERQIQLWRSSTFCDCEIIVEGETFVAHRLVVASSDFLSACFQNAMSEQSGHVVLHDARASIFRLALEFMYTGCAEIPQSALLEFLELASRLQLEGLVEKIAACLKSSVDTENCIAIWTFADQLALNSLKELKLSCRDVALRHFAQLPHAELSEKLLYNLLERKIRCTEEDAFRGLMTWARVQAPTHGKMAALLRNIWFSEMAPSFVKMTVLTEPLVAPHMEIVVERLLERTTRATQLHTPVDTEEYELTYTWRIPNFSEFRSASFESVPASRFSPIFQCREGERWQAMCRSKCKAAEGEGDAAGSPTHLGVYVRCLDTVGDKTITATRSIQVGRFENEATHTHGMPSDASKGWVGGFNGWSHFISYQDLEDPRNGCIVDDTLTIKVALERKATLAPPAAAADPIPPVDVD